jgi:RHS repeat-associated protein
VQTKIGIKYFELSNHASAPLSTGLGNVLTTISDRKIEHSSGSTVEYYTADIISATDYYPFGFAMDERNFSSSDYRFGFNGMEKDDEFTNSTSHYDFGARIYDSRVGRFLSLDPMMNKYPSETPYIFAGNSPVFYIDFNGEYKLSESFKENYPHFTKYLSEQIINDVKKSTILKNALMKYGQYESENQLFADLTDDNGPTLLSVGWPCGLPSSGCVDPDNPEVIELNEDILKHFEGVMNDENSSELDKQAALLSVVSLTLHETTHHQDIETDGENDVWKFISELPEGGSADLGDIFENAVYLNNIKGNAEERFEQSKSIIKFLNQNYQAKTVLPQLPED